MCTLCSKNNEKLFLKILKKNDNDDLFLEVEATNGNGSMNIEKVSLNSFVLKEPMLGEKG